MKHISLIVLFALVSLQLYAQKSVTVYGNVKNTLGAPASSVAVSISKPSSKTVVAFVYTNQIGYYKISFSTDTSTYLLQVSGLEYKKETIVLNLEKGSSINQNFVLKPGTFDLQEIIVKAKRSGVKVNGDTTSYKLSAFANGTEKSVEDVLKKLPGVSVDDNGSISFKGKKIDKVFLDGDDLLGKNYKLATKNINAAFIDEVDVMENFSDVALLKGIEHSDKTILNLKIDKKKRRLLFGSLDASGGINGYNDVQSNIFSSFGKTKIYFIGEHNSIGNKSSTDDNSLTDVGNNTSDEPTLSSSPLINTQNLYSSQFKESRINFNNETLGSLIGTVKPIENLKIEANFSIYTDHNLTSLSNLTNYLSNGEKKFLFSELNNLNRKIVTGNIKVNALYNIDKHSQLEYTLEDRPGRTVTLQNTLFRTDSTNQNINQQLSSNKKIFHQRGSYINRLSSNKALSLEANFFNSSDPQSLNILNNGHYFDAVFAPDTGKNQALQQLVNMVQESNFAAKLIGIKNRFNYNISTGVIILNEKTVTNLSLYPSQSNISYQALYSNHTYLNSENYFAKAGTTYVINKFKLSLNTTFHHTIVHHIDSLLTVENVRYNYIEPSFTFSYKLNDASKFNASYNWNKQFATTLDLASQYFLEDYHTLTRGLSKVIAQNSSAVRIGYTYDDFFSQFNLSSNIFLINKTNSYSYNYYFSEAYNATSKIVVPNSRIYLYVMQIDKYVIPIQANIRLNINYSINSYHSQVNNSSLRSNLFKNAAYRLTYTTAYNGKLNFAIGSILNANSLKIKADNLITKSTNNYSSNFFNVVYRQKKWFATFNNDIYFLDHVKYYFLDANATYNFIKDKFSISITGKNLTNNVSFRQISLSDYQVNSSEYNLIHRYVLLGFNFKF